MTYPYEAAHLIESYFDNLRKREGYIVDGVDSDELLALLTTGGYTIVKTDVLESALNFGYGKQATPDGAIARANLREQLS